MSTSPSVIELSEKAVERSTYIVAAAFNEKVDDVKTPFIPNPGLFWSLRDKNGQVVNERVGQAIASAQVVYIVLKAEDLELVGGPEKRYVTLEGTYNSVYGNNLPFLGEVSFQIKNLKGARTWGLGVEEITTTPVVGSPTLGLV